VRVCPASVTTFAANAEEDRLWGQREVASSPSIVCRHGKLASSRNAALLTLAQAVGGAPAAEAESVHFGAKGREGGGQRASHVPAIGGERARSEKRD